MADDNDHLIEGTHHKKYVCETVNKLVLAEEHLRIAINSGSTCSAAYLNEILAAVSESRQTIESIHSADTKTAEELKAREANMAAAQRIAHFGSWELDLDLTDRDKNPLRWSDEMFRIMGYTPGQVEVSNDLFFQLVHCDDHEPIRKAVESAIRNQSSYSITHRIIRPDGDIRLIHERGELVIDSVNGKTTKLVGTAHDITEKQQAEERLRRSDEWFRCVFNQRFQFMAILSPRGELMAINDLPLQVGGVTREEVLGKLFWETVWWGELPDMRAAWPGRLEAAANSATPILSEDQFMALAGEVRIAAVSIEAIKKNDGTVDFFIVQANDITERKRAEQELRASEQRASQLWATTTDAIIIMNEQQRVEFVNPALTSIFGFPAQTVIDQGMTVIVPERLRDAHNRGLQRYLDSGVRRLDWRSIEAVGLHEDGHEFPIEISFSHFHSSGHNLFAAFIRNISTRKKAEETLRISEEQSRTLAEAMPQLVWTVLPDGSLIHVNQKWIEYTGLSLEESSGWGWLAAVHPEDAGPMTDRWNEVVNTGEAYEAEYRLKQADGTYHWLLGRALPLRDHDGNIIKWLGTCTNIHAMKLSEEVIRKSELNLANSQRIAHLGSWVWQLQSDELGWSDEVYRLFGVLPADVSDPKIIFREGVHPDELESVNAALDAAVKGGEPFNIQHRVVRPDGTVIHVHNQGEIEYDKDGRPFQMTGTILDITGRKLAEEQLIHDALHDALTGLANRTLLADRIQAAFNRFLRTGQVFALIIIDLDRFKNVNDNLGHPVGDQVLIETAKRFLSTARNSDTVARLGGDEFAILLEDINVEDSPTRIAQRLLEAMEHPFYVNGTAVEIGASMGVVVVTPNYTSTDEIFRDADIALYRAKEAGRGVYQVFDKEMHIRIRERMEIENDLRHAIPRQEMSLYLQPIISLKTGTITSYEALLRWNHPRRGFIPPDVFISVAEETGLIRSIGQWVTREACRILHNWPGSHVPSISINASPCEIVPRSSIGSHLPDVEGIDCTIARIAKEENINPNLLRIEITEGVFINDPVKAARVMDQLVANGFKLLLDDFGAGYSSLSYLHDLPFYQVKIDRAFTAKLEPGNRSHELMRGIITLAHNIGLEIVAEGVETEQQLALLRAAGCDYAQGYFISRPIPVEQAWLLHQTERQW